MPSNDAADLPAIDEFYPSFHLYDRCASGNLDLVFGIAYIDRKTSPNYFWVVADIGDHDGTPIIPEKIVVSRPLGKVHETARRVADYLEKPLADFFGTLEAALVVRGLSFDIADKGMIFTVLNDVVPPTPISLIKKIAAERKNLDAVTIVPWQIDNERIRKSIDDSIPKPKKYDDLKTSFDHIVKLEKGYTHHMRSYLKNKQAKQVWDAQKTVEFMRRPDEAWINSQLTELKEMLRIITKQYGYLDNLYKGLIKKNSGQRKRIIMDGDQKIDAPNHIAQQFLRDLPTNTRNAHEKVKFEIAKGCKFIDMMLDLAAGGQTILEIGGKINILADRAMYKNTVATLHECKAQLEQLASKIQTDYPDLEKSRKR